MLYFIALQTYNKRLQKLIKDYTNIVFISLNTSIVIMDLKKMNHSDESIMKAVMSMSKYTNKTAIMRVDYFDTVNVNNKHVRCLGKGKTQRDFNK